MSLDRALQKTNNIQREYGLPPVFYTFLNPPTEESLREIRERTRANACLKVYPPFDGDIKLYAWCKKEPIRVMRFNANYSAHYFIKAIAEASTTAVLQPTKVWSSEDEIIFNDWIRIKSPKLRLIFDYKPKRDECKWHLPHPYDIFARNIARHNIGMHPQNNTRTRESNNLRPLTPEQRKQVGL